MLSGDLRLFVDLYRPRKSGDLSNRVKILEDSLQGFCFKNDSQIVELYCRRFDDKANPRVEVRIERVDDRAELFPITRLITEARYIHV
jgi:Holliday junction resolvase RusA-like endonuclease